MPDILESSRVRASQACEACHARKVKCDAVQGRGPCSRCRMDGLHHCTVRPSHRGALRRQKRQPTTGSETAANTGSRGQYEQSLALEQRGAQTHDTVLDQSRSTTSAPASSFKGNAPTRSQAGSGADGGVREQHEPFSWMSHLPDVPATELILTDTRVASSVDTNSGDTPPSLASMFEDFLRRQEQGGESAAAKLGLMLFGESSPLTFALKEAERGTSGQMYDAGSDLSRNKRLADRPRETHPPHCTAGDIAYLESKDAFNLPDPTLLDQFVTVFLERFYPIYSIVNKSELREAHRACNLPLILLHAICFIGATFCDSSVIFQSGHKSRLHARQSYYDKAKVLFDVGYEVDKFVLLQTVIMLSFWGPQMKSYWNPCSWIGFGATIAESLGIHRSTSSVHATGTDQSLVKRLWWSLAVRDAYCAALLGRPFRINAVQCDTTMLNIEDFQIEGDFTDSAMYQIQIAKLSIVLRRIVERLYVHNHTEVDSSGLHDLLDAWKAQIPSALQWTSTALAHVNIFSTSLKLLYHHHNILIHLGQSGDRLSATTGRPYSDSVSSLLAESAAQIISSTAAGLVTKHITKQLPHEVFAGFFLAGIVFYRQQRQHETLVAQVARASLDNCQMLLNEIRDSWDPAYWGLRIFDFLLCSSASFSRDGTVAEPQQVPVNTAGVEEQRAAEREWLGPGAVTSRGNLQEDASLLYNFDPCRSPIQDLNGNFNDFLLMPNFFVPTLE